MSTFDSCLTNLTSCDGWLKTVQRYLLADEVGLGKTVEAGCILRQFP